MLNWEKPHLGIKSIQNAPVSNISQFSSLEKTEQVLPTSFYNVICASGSSYYIPMRTEPTVVHSSK